MADKDAYIRDYICVGCGWCVGECPGECIYQAPEESYYIVDPECCCSTSYCFEFCDMCPVDAIVFSSCN